jgi:hypothetical protein
LTFKRALVIAVDEYCKLPRLEFCKKDGKKMINVLREAKVDISDNMALVGKVNCEDMRNSIIKFFTDKAVKPKDILLFYYSGHGVVQDNGTGYLTNLETDP